MMRGIEAFIAQQMGPKPQQRSTKLLRMDLRTSSGVISAPADCLAEVFLWGGGGSGEVAAGYRAGGGGGALYKSFQRLGGTTVTFEVGSGGQSQGVAGQPGYHGGPTTLRLPSGVILVAGGGRGGGRDGQAGLGGISYGGEVNRPGEPGSQSIGKGGDSASFADLSALSIFAAGLGATYPGATGGAPGGGSNSTDGTNPSGAGGRGQVLYLLHEL